MDLLVNHEKYEKYKKKYLNLKKTQNELKHIGGDNKKNLGDILYEILKKFDIKYYFGLPSDLNMPFIDSLETCCKNDTNFKCTFIVNRNELNATYMAEGYSRHKLFSLCLVGGMVGTLAGCNGLGNAICEKHQILMICGGNNSNDENEGKMSHHTLFKGIDDQLNIYKIMESLVGSDNCLKINSLEESMTYNVFDNIFNSLMKFESSFVLIPVNYQNKNKLSVECINNCISKITDKFENIKNELSHQYNFKNLIESIIKKQKNLIENKKNIVILIGSAYNHLFKLGINLIDNEFYEYINKINGKLYYTIDAKGVLDETKDCVKGCYWGGITSNEILEEFTIAANESKLFFVGVIFSDYNTSGYTSLFKPTIDLDCQNIHPHSKSIVLNVENEFDNNENNRVTNLIVTGIQNLINLGNKDIDIFVETGSSWFYGSELKIPEGYNYNMSVKYASIGWCFPASIGNSFAVPNRKTICLTGDGAFLCVMQELATAATFGKNKKINHILIIIKNNKYQIENVLDNEPYNDLPIVDFYTAAKSFGCNENNIKNCNIDNFEKVLRDVYLKEADFYVIILNISDKIINVKMSNWAKLVSKYTTKYTGNGLYEKD